MEQNSSIMQLDQLRQQIDQLEKEYTIGTKHATLSRFASNVEFEMKYQLISTFSEEKKTEFLDAPDWEERIKKVSIWDLREFHNGDESVLEFWLRDTTIEEFITSIQFIKNLNSHINLPDFNATEDDVRNWIKEIIPSSRQVMRRTVDLQKVAIVALSAVDKLSCIRRKQDEIQFLYY
jgi:hypothetical protein